MKFLTKINRNYLGLLTVILLVISLAGYVVIQKIMLVETKESLLDKERFIIHQIQVNGKIPQVPPIIEGKEIDTVLSSDPAFTVMEIYNESEDEMEPFIEYTHQFSINGASYAVKIRQSIFESEDVVGMLALTVFMLLFSAFGILFFISKKINK